VQLLLLPPFTKKWRPRPTGKLSITSRKFDLTFIRQRRYFSATTRSYYHNRHNTTLSNRYHSILTVEQIEIFCKLITYLNSCLPPKQWHPHGATAPSGLEPLCCRGFTITLRHTTVGRTPLWTSDQPVVKTSTRQQIFTGDKTSILQAILESANPASERPQTHALEREAIWIGQKRDWNILYFYSKPHAVALLSTLNN